MGFPPSGQKLTIFETEPTAATETIFNQGLLGTSSQQEALSVILFSPNLQIIASLDNTNSKVTSTYQTSVSHGFTFSTTQSLSVTTEVGINIEVVTAKVSVTFALSFTEQWNTTTTKSMSFSCPPGQKAFVYQGTLMAKVMAFDARNAKYAWQGAAGKALTEVLVTSQVPIGSAPSNAVSIGS